MNANLLDNTAGPVSAGCHINDVMNCFRLIRRKQTVSAGCHINDVMNHDGRRQMKKIVSAGCHINDVTKCVN